jgi:hypothetical protein
MKLPPHATRDRAQKEGLIGRQEVDGAVYLWFK